MRDNQIALSNGELLRVSVGFNQREPAQEQCLFSADGPVLFNVHADVLPEKDGTYRVYVTEGKSWRILGPYETFEAGVSAAKGWFVEQTKPLRKNNATAAWEEPYSIQQSTKYREDYLMTSRETQLLHRLHAVLSSILWPQARHTAALEAVTDYGDDMRFVQPKIVYALDLLAENQLDEAKEVILALEVWALGRQAVDWK